MKWGVHGWDSPVPVCQICTIKLHRTFTGSLAVLVSANMWEMHTGVGAPVFALLRKEEHPMYLFKLQAGETDSNFLGVFHSAVAVGLLESMMDVK